VKQKGFIPIIILLVVALGVVVYLAYTKGYISINFPQPSTNNFPVVTSSPSLLLNSTADWKTYKNVALGFELQYPAAVKIDKEMNDQYNRAAIFKGEGLNFEVMLRGVGGVSLDKYYFMDNPSFSKAFLDSKSANVYVYDASQNSCVSDGTGPGCPLSYVTYVTQNGSDLYHVSFFGDAVLSNTEAEILSTFKFTQ